MRAKHYCHSCCPPTIRTVAETAPRHRNPPQRKEEIGLKIPLLRQPITKHAAIAWGELKPHFETRAVAGLFFAGQINGTTGYEEPPPRVCSLA